MKKILKLLIISFLLFIGINNVEAKKLSIEEIANELNKYITVANEANVCYNSEINITDNNYIHIVFIDKNNNGNCLPANNWYIEIYENGELVHFSTPLYTYTINTDDISCDQISLTDFWIEKTLNLFNINIDEFEHNNIFYKTLNDEVEEKEAVYGYSSYSASGSCIVKDDLSTRTVNYLQTVGILNGDFVKIVENTINSIKLNINPVEHRSQSSIPAKIYRSIDGNDYKLVFDAFSSANEINQEKKNVFVDNNLEPGTTYYYKIENNLGNNKDPYNYVFAVKTQSLETEDNDVSNDLEINDELEDTNSSNNTNNTITNDNTQEIIHDNQSNINQDISNNEESDIENIIDESVDEPGEVLSTGITNYIYFLSILILISVITTFAIKNKTKIFKI